MIPSSILPAALLLGVLARSCIAAESQVAELSFDTSYLRPEAMERANVPAWVKKVEQQLGSFSEDPKCWFVPASQAKGAGKLSIELDRERLKTDLVATVLFEAGEGADLTVQLVDEKGLVVVVDLFGNLVDVGRDAMTNTLVIPLRKYPTARKIVLRRIKGAVTVYGVVLYPVMSEGDPEPGAMEELARVLGDPLSPENPLVKSLQGVAKNGKVALHATPRPSATEAPKTAASGHSESEVKKAAAAEKYPAAQLPPKGASVPASANEGLLAHFDFEDGVKDASGRENHGRLKGNPTNVPGVRGQALQLERRQAQAFTVPRSKNFDLQEPLSFTVWVRYTSIAPKWGSQIIWCGDRRLGRDPWTLSLRPGGQLQFRSDRSVTGEAKFTVFANELQFVPGRKALATQHVSVLAPKLLAENTWYFVAATVEKVSPRARVMRLYVNGEPAGELRTEETLDYGTDSTWVTVGAVDTGTWQNFEGALDDLRIYGRTLGVSEVRAIYGE